MYAGAHYRCAYCHTHQKAPAADRTRVKRKMRPDQPGLRLQPLSGAYASPMLSANVSIDIPRLPEISKRSRLTRFHAGASAFAALVISASVLTWNWSSAISNGDRFRRSDRVAIPRGGSAHPEIATMLAASDTDDFFGVPIDSGGVGLVIDDHDRLGGYTDAVARLAYAATDFARTNETPISVVEARLRGAGSSGDDSDPFYAFSVMRIQAARKRLDMQVPEQSLLSTAVSMTMAESPSQVFLVISEPLSNKEIDELAMAIETANTPVHLICLGDAANQPYAQLAAISGGKFIPVTDAEMDDLVARCQVTMPAPRAFRPI